MAGKEFQLEHGGQPYNGARDTDGGVWIRMQDVRDHRILAAAVSKQIKNADAAKGTLSALDPDAPHHIDYVGEALQRILDSVNGALPVEAQLAGTPIGDAMNGAQSATTGKKGKKGKGAAAAAADAVKEADAAVAPIEWASDVPEPRPQIGDSVWPGLVHGEKLPSAITKVYGYDPESQRFDVETEHGRVSVINDAGWMEWTTEVTEPLTPSQLGGDRATQRANWIVQQLRQQMQPLDDGIFESVVLVAADLVQAATGRSADERTKLVDNWMELGTADQLAHAIEQSLGTLAAGDSLAQLGGEVRAASAEVRAKGKPAAKKAGKSKPAGKGAKKQKR